MLQHRHSQEVEAFGWRWARGWGAMILLPVAVLLFLPRNWPAWTLMWSLALAIFAGAKWLTWRRATIRGAPAWLHLAYLFIWPGLNASEFLGLRATGRAQPDPCPTPSDTALSASQSAASDPVSAGEWLFACAKLAIGVILLYGVARLIPAHLSYITGWVGMVGIVMILHFGSFHLISCAWRAAGVNAPPLMDWPLLSPSLAEFWGRRWNRPFPDLAEPVLFRPLSRRIGPRAALVGGFAFSGVLHDVVVSLPPGAGWGGPTAFFLLQPLAMLVERSRKGRRMGLGKGVRGWAFTMAALAAPALALFHPPFVVDVIVPFMDDIGAI